MDSLRYKRILFLGKPDAGILDVVRDLTGAAPEPDVDGSVAGLAHSWDVKTAYYSATIPIWIDELSNTTAWKIEFLKEEARQVVTAVGAWVYCFRSDESSKDNGAAGISSEVEEGMQAIQEILETHSASYGADVVALAVAMPHPTQRKQPGAQQEDHARDTTLQEDLCMQYSFEYIDYMATGKNEYGEKLGKERVKEALEANEWDAGPASDDEGILEDLDIGSVLADADNENAATTRDIHGFGREEAEMTAELFGVKAALAREEYGDGQAQDLGPDENHVLQESVAHEADQVDALDRMMGQLLALKEQSGGLPLPQRKQLAAKAVQQILKDNPGL